LTRNRQRKEIYATPEHRWFVRAGKTLQKTREAQTRDLKPGDLLVSKFPGSRVKLTTPSPFGIAHGITFGDGTLNGTGSMAQLDPVKDAMLRKWFPNSVMIRGSPQIQVHHLPRFFKSPPPLGESVPYLYRWLAGYFAADGHVSKDGTVMLNSARREHLEFVRSACSRLGIGTYGITRQDRQGFPDRKVSPLYRIHFVNADLTEEFFLLDGHRMRYMSAEKGFARRGWAVQSVEPTDRVEEVFCAVVPEGHAFVLEDNILTGNCFGCHAGGDAFDFMMRIANQSFPEALAALAERTGVPLERTPEDARDRSEREQVLRALDAAAAFYRAALSGGDGETARAYLTRRGVRPETVEEFGLGYAPSTWDGLLRALAEKGYEAAALDRAGLVTARSQGGGHFDLLRHRLIFPIEDLQDRTVAFGGRALDREATPKYLNSRESAAFQKGQLLYLLNRARKAIRETNEVVVVEGYMDALACHQAGVRNAVATLGTALTLDHVLLLKRFAARVTLVYDADAAGRLASERGAQLFEEAELPASVAVLPAGSDPDAFLRREGQERFRTILSDALSMFDYQVHLAEMRHDARTLEGRVALADELLPVISLVLNPVRQSEYLRAIAQRFDLSEEALRQRLASRRRSDRRGVGESLAGMAPPTPARWKAERFLLHLMVQESPARDVVREALSVGDFLDPLHRKLVQVLLDEDAPAEALRERLPDQESIELLNRLLFEPLATEEKDRDKVQADSIEFFRTEGLKEERRRIQRALQEAQAAGDEERVTQLQSAFLALRERGRNENGERRKGGEEHGAEKGAGP
jgi:DNA primase